MSKKIFISYAWGDKEHQEWVVDLGKRLLENTIDVVLDRWSLKEGHDIHDFMESMVKAEDIDRVLIICDKTYKEKADKRDGGVGTETQIITPSIYADQKQEKFVPIVLEKDNNGKTYLPIFLASRKYIDFSNEEYFESSYEELLRNILDVPSIAKPKIGNTIPLYITESATNNLNTNSQVRVLENQLTKTPNKVNLYFSNFIENFLESLWDFEMFGGYNTPIALGEELYNKILDYKILRDDFINCLLIVLKPEFNLDIEILIDFFEESVKYRKPRDGQNQYLIARYDIFKIIFQELFIYTIAISIRNKNYRITSELFYSRYYVSIDGDKTSPVRFTFLYTHSDILEEYFRQKHQKITGFGNYLITNLHVKIAKEDFILADLLCHYIADLYTSGYSDNWFPTTYIYREESSHEFFEKFSSMRHFERVKSIFDVEDVEQMKKLLKGNEEAYTGKNRWYISRPHNHVYFLYELIQRETIGQNR